jgi:hypothetical protein
VARLFERPALMPKPEPETEVQGDLHDLGCPYPAHDPRSLVWIEGFKAGMDHGGEIARQAVIDTLAGMRK